MQQSLSNISCEDGVYTDVQAYRAVVAPVVFDERLYNSAVHRDKAIKRLCTARGQYTNLIHNIADTWTRLSEFPSTREALLTSVRVAMTRQITPTINTLYMVARIRDYDRFAAECSGQTN